MARHAAAALRGEQDGSAASERVQDDAVPLAAIPRQARDWRYRLDGGMKILPPAPAVGKARSAWIVQNIGAVVRARLRDRLIPPAVWPVKT